MSEETPAADLRHGPIRRIADLLSAHHERAKRQHQEADMADAIAAAAFDLGADIARPAAPPHERVGFDAASDLGIGRQSPE
ncbi:hypothetical protein OG828_10890 [Streptomyces sp. NBC_00457]|uniref:hypothetical protein n=1 Tax=unclassified Streptomyces TaxID=2593676 RepID=UPI002E224C07|nr:MULTISPECIES: hypothetical protein [unclassified Streptomyces]